MLVQQRPRTAQQSIGCMYSSAHVQLSGALGAAAPTCSSAEHWVLVQQRPRAAAQLVAQPLRFPSSEKHGATVRHTARRSSPLTSQRLVSPRACDFGTPKLGSRAPSRSAARRRSVSAAQCCSGQEILLPRHQRTPESPKGRSPVTAGWKRIHPLSMVLSGTSGGSEISSALQRCSTR